MFPKLVLFKESWKGKLSSNQVISWLNLPWLGWYISKSANQFYLLVNWKHHINCCCSLKLLINFENLNQCAFLHYYFSVIGWNVFLDLEMWEKNFHAKKLERKIPHLGIADFSYNTEYLRIMKNKIVLSKIIRRPFHSYFYLKKSVPTC